MIHAACKTLVFEMGSLVATQGNYQAVYVVRNLSDMSGCFVPVHHRHLNVHENHRVNTLALSAFNFVKSQFAVVSLIRLDVKSCLNDRRKSEDIERLIIHN